MELFLPSLLLLVLAGILVVGVYPYMSPTLLAALSFLILTLVLYEHKQFFRDEYASLSWREAFQGSSGTILIGILVVFMVGFLLNLLGKWLWPSRKANAAVPADITRYIQNLKPNFQSITPTRNVGSTAFYRKYFS